MEDKNNWSLYEVFVRSKQGLSHRHVGSLRAPDDEIALQHARDVYTRRNEGISIWVVRSELIKSSQPDEKLNFRSFFRQGLSSSDFYHIPDGIEHM